eukprot:SAG11_NODE_3771_length_2236_cov_2.717829_3_plen_75_part_00
MKPVPKLLLLQKFLRQVLQVPLRECDLCIHNNLAVSVGDGNIVAQYASLAVDLDSLKKKLLLREAASVSPLAAG